MPQLEVWGGIEATIVRIGDRWRDQVQDTGHYARACDLERIASVGITTLRYPVLWESVAPRRGDEMDWAWHDLRLRRLRALGIDVIAGLVHHGSGPCYTDLLDPCFGEKLAHFAGAAAARYPWIKRFTPVNEPLTTARFSALYGHWYPHHRNEQSFLRALVNQCRGIVLAMQAVRRVTPSAQLIQTEDLGKTFSSQALQYQADFENHRRWLSFDLLCGRVDAAHPLHDHLLQNGISKAELGVFQEQPCPPDVLGMNHYPTSERYLDERTHLFAPASHGGNGRHRYADVEAVRMDLPPATLGPQARLQDLWERYRSPVVISEVHHGCTREEQLRWFMQAWRAAHAVRQTGAEVRAITAWALLGVMDWNSLLLDRGGVYEAGAFDIRSTPPRRTILATAIASLVQRQDYQHPVLATPGWWQRNERLYGHLPAPVTSLAPSPPVLMIGADTGLATALKQCCAVRGLSLVTLSSGVLDTREPLAIQQIIQRYSPWAVIDATCRTVSDFGRTEPGSGGAGISALVAACRKAGILLAGFSGARPGSHKDSESEGGAYRFVAAPLPEEKGKDLTPFSDMLIISAEVLREDNLPLNEQLSWLPGMAHAALDLLIDGATGRWVLSSARHFQDTASELQPASDGVPAFDLLHGN
jgi:dTDP-4-dehydrorhamnose reductase